VACNTANLRADHLDRAHERIGEHERPPQGIAELRAGPGIGGYAAGIIVRGAGDLIWSEEGRTFIGGISAALPELNQKRDANVPSFSGTYS
jgi:hypothetical protein